MDQTIDMNFLIPFIEGTKHAFKVQASQSLTNGLPYFEFEDDLSINKKDIIGTVRISSEKFSGTVCIAFPEETFLNVMNEMLDEKFLTITNDNADGAGEMINIIYGHAKKILNECGYHFEKSLPEITFGPEINRSGQIQGPTIIIPFDSKLGAFQLEITSSKFQENTYV